MLNLNIDLSKKENLRLILRKNRKVIAEYKWPGLYQLSEMLLSQIDKFLKTNKVKLADIGNIKVAPSKESMVSTRIAQAIALGLKVR